MSQELIIFCDESEQYGKYFSNFYGGLLVRSTDYLPVTNFLKQKKIDLGFLGEVKWSKVTGNYLDKYLALIDCLFDLIEQDKIKIRIMFSHNQFVPVNLTERHFEERYFRLYYQFIKHAFGFPHAEFAEDVSVRVYLDRLPDTAEKVRQFKGYLAALTHNPDFRRSRISIAQDQITEVESHEHVLLQGMDIILGAIHFRLNDKHKEKPDGQTRRGKRTIAKEKLYDHIRRRIRIINPNFNIGVNTGMPSGLRDRWEQSYRHWSFVPREYRIDKTKTKK